MTNYRKPLVSEVAHINVESVLNALADKMRTVSQLIQKAPGAGKPNSVFFTLNNCGPGCSTCPHLTAYQNKLFRRRKTKTDPGKTVLIQVVTASPLRSKNVRANPQITALVVIMLELDARRRKLAAQQTKYLRALTEAKRAASADLDFIASLGDHPHGD